MIIMKAGLKFIVPLACVALSPVNSFADTFGSGANTFTLDFVNIGNAGNAADNTGYGSVGYNYRMGKYEVSRGMIDAYNALSAGPSLSMQDMTSYGGNGADKPATGISWNEAARFVNWLNTSSGHSVAYKFATAGSNDNIALWEAGDVGYDSSNPFRNSNAYYFLPSENEWYKAAYYDPNHGGIGVGGYWDYPTGSDAFPSHTSGGVLDNTAVFTNFSAGPANVNNAGGLSIYGTMAQGGNAYEWAESSYSMTNANSTDGRTFRGYDWSNGNVSILASEARQSADPTWEYRGTGFRVASIPEPSSFMLIGFSVLGLLMRRKRCEGVNSCNSMN